MDKSEKFWDRRSSDYDKNEKKYKQTYFKAIENTKRYLNKNNIVLDYGCGTGIVTNEIADSVKKVQAIDISPKMIDVAKAKAEKLNIGNINYLQSTIFDNRFKIESFNVILAFNILHLLEDTQEVMQRIHELLKPEGLFISATACLGERVSFLGILLPILSKIRIVPYVKIYKFSELEDLIANRNFLIVETKDLQHSPQDYFIIAKKLPGT
jgi:2-polyprenyl-3-methyl-5-hydroxy-6-metoxy-1,4-benzoquinol methylase